jgi:GntR family transcriptional regulator
MPVYRQVADDIRRRIDEGTYAPGSQLPSERDLGEEFDISRVTVRQAVGLLRSQGVVVVEHGRGVFVARARQVQRLSRSRLSRDARDQDKGAFLGDAAGGGFTPSVSVRISFEPADDRIAELLNVPAGTELTVRTRVMQADGQAVQLATSRLSRVVTRGTAIEENDTGLGGMYARLEEAGHHLAHFAEHVGCRMPTPEEQQLLQLDTGQPVLTVTRVAHADIPVEVNDMILAGDRYELSYEWPAD